MFLVLVICRTKSRMRRSSRLVEIFQCHCVHIQLHLSNHLGHVLVQLYDCLYVEKERGEVIED